MFKSEKWLPYKAIERPVIVQKIKHVTQKPPTPKNVIIEYEKPKAVAIRQVIEEGVFRVDPTTYQTSTAPGGGEVRIVDRITDLPIENSRIISHFDGDPASIKSSSEKTSKNIYSNILATSSILNSSSESNNKNDMLDLKKLSGGNRRASEHFDLVEAGGGNNIFSPASIVNSNNTTTIGFYNMASDAYEYETITTSVPESLAQKIIAEARAAGITHRAGSHLN